MTGMNRQGRPTAPMDTPPDHSGTFTGNRGLQLEEPLIFETGRTDFSGVDVAAVTQPDNRLAGLDRHAPIGLPGLSEPETMRHYVRLSQKNHAIDMNLYPLGSCTMKHNPRLNEQVMRLPGFSEIHPLQPQQTVQGALELMKQLADLLLTITGMRAIALSPKAGAHGESCGMMAITAALANRGEARKKILVADSAHGTNPATSALLGYEIVTVAAGPSGILDKAEVAKAMDEHVAAMMLTNPNTCGLFEPDIAAIAQIVHEKGGYFYCDGANFNAIAGKVLPGALGVDAMHLNLHKSFSTPHGGGGPGAGPVVLSEALAPFAPVPFIVSGDDATLRLIEHVAEARAGDGEGSDSFGRMTAFHGQMGMFVRALAYMLSHGRDGMRQASEDAVLAANYLRVCLSDLFSAPFGDRPCMHEMLFDDRFLKNSGITTLDFAKAMIDEGFHPMTIYFPLVVHGAMLIEPTESESKASLDLFIATLRDLALTAQAGDTRRFSGAPYFTPRRRLDETRAAREPILRWQPRAQMDAAQ